MKLVLQFHADRRELTGWIGAWVRELGLHVALHPPGPDLPVVVPHRADGDELVLPERIRQISLSTYPLEPSYAGPREFLDANPHVLTVLVGRQGPDHLRESVLGAQTDDETSLATWKKLRTRATRLMARGATVTDPASGAQRLDRHHHCSPGARALARNGVKLLAVAGWVEYLPLAVRTGPPASSWPARRPTAPPGRRPPGR